MNRNALTQYSPMTLLSQKVAIATAEAKSTPLPKDAHGARLYATQDCYIEFEGAAGTTVSMFFPLGKVEYFALPPTNSTSAEGIKISVIRATADGTLYITPMTV